MRDRRPLSSRWSSRGPRRHSPCDRDATVQLPDLTYAIAFSPDGMTLAAGGGDRDFARTRFTDRYAADADVHLWDLTRVWEHPARPVAPSGWTSPVMREP